MQGVGVVVGNCSFPHGAKARVLPPRECCSVIFGVVKGAKCYETAHHMVLEQALAARVHEPPAAVTTTLTLSEAIRPATARRADGSSGSGSATEIDVSALRSLGRSLTQPIVWLDVPELIAAGGELPRLVGLSEAERQAVGELVHDECRSQLSTLA